MKQKFYICSHCGNITAYAEYRGAAISCCGEKMTEMIPNTTEGATEKHLPVIRVEDGICSITVGRTNHPMSTSHYIKWVSLDTKQGNQKKFLIPDTSPEISFALADGDEVVCAYAYCNLHGLWRANI